LGQPFALRKAPEDWKLVQECLRDALESLWDSVWSYQAQIALESLRQRVLFGGEVQQWVDADAVGFFNLG
jgi:hypothetical protein